MGGTGAPVVGGLNTVPASGSYGKLATGDKRQTLEFVMPTSAVEITPVFESANDSSRSPYIIYWDESSQTMQVGSWKAGPGGYVEQNNMLNFHFGSTIGFTNTADAFDATDIKFNLTSDTGWTALNDWDDWFGSGLTGAPVSDGFVAETHAVDGYISTPAYHYLANVKAGRGDPCKLVGLTKAEIMAGKIDNGLFRMPTNTEQINAGYAVYTGYGAFTSYADNTKAGFRNGAGDFLPASGYRKHGDGYIESSSRGAYGHYWTSQPVSDATGRTMIAYNTKVDINIERTGNYGFSVYCVPNTGFTILAATNTGQALSAQPVGSQPAGMKMTLTAPAIEGYKFVNWTFTGATLTFLDSSTASSAIVKFLMPDNNLSAMANYVSTIVEGGHATPPGGEVLVPTSTGDVYWAATNVGPLGRFAPVAAMYDDLNQWDWATITGAPNNTASYTAGTTATNVCPTGWRLPTVVEMRALGMTTTSAPWTTLSGVNGRQLTVAGATAPNNKLFFAASGLSQGTASRGVLGCYWTSTQNNATNAETPYFSNTSVTSNDISPKDYLFSVRCVRPASESKYFLSALSSLGSAITPNPATAQAPGVDIALTAVPPTGYAFDKWVPSGGVTPVYRTGSASTAAIIIDMPASNNLVMTATYKLVDRKVTLNVESPSAAAGSYTVKSTSGGTSTSGTAAVTHTTKAGELVTLAATPATGYAFKSWTVTGATPSSTTTNPTTFTMPTADVTVQAVFEQIKYRVTDVQSANGITVTNGSNAATALSAAGVLPGTSVTFDATAATGYTLATLTAVNASTGAAVTDTNTTVGRLTFLMPSFDVKIKSTSTVDAKYSLAVATNTGLTLTPNPAGPQLAGTDIELKAPKILGYKFTNWSSVNVAPTYVTGSATTEIIIIDMPTNNDLTMKANYSLLPDDDVEFPNVIIGNLEFAGRNVKTPGVFTTGEMSVANDCKGFNWGTAVGAPDNTSNFFPPADGTGSVCPTGWRVMSTADSFVMYNVAAVGNIPGGRGSTVTFNGVSGVMFTTPSGSLFFPSNDYWTSSQYTATAASCRQMQSPQGMYAGIYNNKSYAKMIRCVRDATPL